MVSTHKDSKINGKDASGTLICARFLLSLQCNRVQSAMFWYLNLAVLLLTWTAIPQVLVDAKETQSNDEKKYFPSSCREDSFIGDTCGVACRGRESCAKLDIPAGANLQHFIVRCVNKYSCKKMALKESRTSVTTYLMCLTEDSCKSSDTAAQSATFVYCVKDCGLEVGNKGVQTITTKNGVPIVIFSNNDAVARSVGSTEDTLGFIPSDSGVPDTRDCSCDEYQLSGVDRSWYNNRKWERVQGRLCADKPVYKGSANRYFFYDKGQKRWEFSDKMCGNFRNWFFGSEEAECPSDNARMWKAVCTKPIIVAGLCLVFYVALKAIPLVMTHL